MIYGVLETKTAKEIVKWVEENLEPYFVASTERDWEAKLKEWGIDGN